MLIDQLKAERHRQDLTLQQLAERIGRKTYQSIWQWENGAVDLRLSNLDEWARGLGYEVTLTRTRTGHCWYRLGHHRPENIYQVTPEHPDGRYMGHACDPADAALIVEALNRMEAQ